MVRTGKLDFARCVRAFKDANQESCEKLSRYMPYAALVQRTWSDTTQGENVVAHSEAQLRNGDVEGRAAATSERCQNRPSMGTMATHDVSIEPTSSLRGRLSIEESTAD